MTFFYDRRKMSFRYRIGWIYIYYHTYYKDTPKEHWQNSILELESTAYTTTAQAWALVQRYYPVNEKELTKDEKN